MRKVLFLLTIFITLTSCLSNNQTVFESGNLWKVTSRGGIESYVFATIHLYPKNELEISNSAILNLKKCRILALEFNSTDSLERKKIRNYKRPNSSSIGVNALITEYGYEELVSMEYQLIEIAQDNGLVIIGLESADEKLLLLEEVNETEVLENEMTDKMWVQLFREGFELYREEKIGAVKNKMLYQEPKMMELMVNQRNKNWLNNIITSIDKEPTFIAVGMSHLGGKEGLLNLLHNKGYILEKIR